MSRKKYQQEICLGSHGPRRLKALKRRSSPSQTTALPPHLFIFDGTLQYHGHQISSGVEASANHRLREVQSVGGSREGELFAQDNDRVQVTDFEVGNIANPRLPVKLRDECVIRLLSMFSFARLPPTLT